MQLKSSPFDCFQPWRPEALPHLPILLTLQRPRRLHINPPSTLSCRLFTFTFFSLLGRYPLYTTQRLLTFTSFHFPLYTTRTFTDSQVSADAQKICVSPIICRIHGERDYGRCRRFKNTRDFCFPVLFSRDFYFSVNLDQNRMQTVTKSCLSLGRV